MSRMLAEKHLGVLENLLASMIFFSPNFLLFYPFFQKHLFVMILYNYVIIFILVSIISHLKFNNETKELQKPKV